MIKVSDYNIVFSEVPDEVTLALNISNCPIHCQGCHSPWLWDDIGEELTEEALDNLIDRYKSEITCVCFMGGDSDQTRINALAKHCKAKHKEVKTAWYSGRESISEQIEIQNFNYIKTGKYEVSKGGLKSKGTNQKMFRILPDGKKEDITARFQSKA